MSFREQTAAFFDELACMIDKKRKKDLENNPRPFSSLLTQDEEPVPDDYTEVPDEDPEVITRL